MAGRGGTAGMIGGANPAVMQSQARALRDVERENQRVAVAVARPSQKISDQSLVSSEARRVGKEWVRTCRARWSHVPANKNSMRIRAYKLRLEQISRYGKRQIT